MKTDNEKIAEFMGWQKASKGYMVPNLYPFTGYSTGETECTDTEMEFHRRWDWLIPAVEKIDKLYHNTFPSNSEFIRRILAKEQPFEGPYMDVIALPLATPIDEVYKAVVQFIDWYNNNTSQTLKK
jgi:hypothetical protein